jgi:hypothetical protein
LDQKQGRPNWYWNLDNMVQNWNWVANKEFGFHQNSYLS